MYSYSLHYSSCKLYTINAEVLNITRLIVLLMEFFVDIYINILFIIILLIDSWMETIH
jgi:hypothetical protein